jgi:hypothetical protein
MDTDMQLRVSPEQMRARHATVERLQAAGSIAAEMLDASGANGVEPSSKDIADAIVHWLKTGERGQ